MSTDSITEQPEAGTVVIDCEHDKWEREGDDWHCLDSDTATRTWTQLVAEFGPVRLVAPPVPEASVLPSDYEIRRDALLAAASMHAGQDFSAHNVFADAISDAKEFEKHLRGEGQ